MSKPTFTPVDDWFHDAIITGIQGLVSLGLDGAPSSDTIEATTRVWITVLWDAAPIKWDRAQDIDRLGKAFMKLAMTCDRWPAPKKLLEALPSRPEVKALPAPIGSGPSPEIKRRLMASIKELTAKMRIGS